MEEIKEGQVTELCAEKKKKKFYFECFFAFFI